MFSIAYFNCEQTVMEESAVQTVDDHKDGVVLKAERHISCRFHWIPGLIWWPARVHLFTHQIVLSFCNDGQTMVESESRRTQTDYRLDFRAFLTENYRIRDNQKNTNEFHFVFDTEFDWRVVLQGFCKSHLDWLARAIDCESICDRKRLNETPARLLGNIMLEMLENICLEYH